MIYILKKKITTPFIFTLKDYNFQDFLSSLMLDKIWIHCSLVIPKVLLFRPKKPCRKFCEVINRKGSVLEKDKKEILMMKCGAAIYRDSLRLLRCLSKTEFWHSKDDGARASAMGKGRTAMASW